MSTAERMYDDREYRWRGPSMRIHPAWIVLLILGFIVWWPVGLAILAFTFFVLIHPSLDSARRKS